MLKMYSRYLKIGSVVILNIFLVLISLFSRSFVGLSYKNLLLGEAIVGLGLALCLLAFISTFGYFKDNNITSNLNITFKLIIITFIISVIYFNSEITNTYIFKTSSYIWSLGFFFFSGYVLSNVDDTKILRISLTILLPFLYLFSTGYYPDRFILFFNNYSDKFQFPKSSDTLLILIVTNLLLKKSSKEKFLLYLFSSTALFLPLFLFQSRGTFLALVVFLILEIGFNFKHIFFKIRSLAYLFCFLLIFTISSFHTSGLTYEEDILITVSDIPGDITDSVLKLANKNDQRKVFLSFYFMDGRLYSEDTTTNWRLDIWQDVIHDLNEKNQVFSGYGYNQIIPVMLDLSKPGRLGRDGNNENVHNYLVNILARGGVFQLVLFIFFNIFIIYNWKEKYKQFYILSLVIPSILNGLTDINFEGVQFPFIYFIMLGYFMKNNIKDSDYS